MSAIEAIERRFEEIINRAHPDRPDEMLVGPGIMRELVEYQRAHGLWPNGSAIIAFMGIPIRENRWAEPGAMMPVMPEHLTRVCHRVWDGNPSRGHVCGKRAGHTDGVCECACGAKFRTKPIGQPIR